MEAGQKMHIKYLEAGQNIENISKKSDLDDLAKKININIIDE